MSLFDVLSLSCSTVLLILSSRERIGRRLAWTARMAGLLGLLTVFVARS